MDADGSAGGGGRLSAEIQRDQTAQSAGLGDPGEVCGAELSMPSSGRASPSLHWEWTKIQRKHKLKPVLGLTPNMVQKVDPGQYHVAWLTISKKYAAGREWSPSFLRGLDKSINFTLVVQKNYFPVRSPPLESRIRR